MLIIHEIAAAVPSLYSERLAMTENIILQRSQ